MEEKIKQLDEVYSNLKGLGQGGASTVYKAKRLEDGETVAIKKLKKDERYEREISVSDLPPHENILAYSTSCKLYDKGAEARFLEGPYFDSKALMGHVSEVLTNLEPKDKIFIMLSIAKALDHLHNNKKIHRDVKPENVLVKTSENNEITAVKLIDYGVSKTVSEDFFGGITGSEEFIGTERTSSPKALSSSKYYNKLDDIYSAGVTFIEILLEHKWTDNMTPAEIKMYQYDVEFEKLLKTKQMDLPLWLFELLSIMTYKSENDRINSMSIVVDALSKEKNSDWWLTVLERNYRKYKINLDEWVERKVVAKCTRCGLIYTFKGLELAKIVRKMNIEWSDLRKDHYFPTDCMACREEVEDFFPPPYPQPPTYTYSPGRIIEILPNEPKSEKIS